MRRRRLISLTVIAWSIAGGLAACGGDDDAGPSFCSLLQRSDQIALDTGSGTSVTPDEVRATLTEGVQLVDELVAAAPDDVAADVQVVHDGFTEYAAAFESVGYDVTALENDPAALQRSEALYSDAVAQATANLASYGDAECGITLGR